MVKSNSAWSQQLSVILQHERTSFRFLYLLKSGEHFNCTECGHERFSERWERRKLVCCRCRKEVSPFSGTILHRSHIPLKSWIEACREITSSEMPMCATSLQKLLGLGSYRSAWLMLCKLRKAMEPENNRRMAGVIEMNDRVYRGQGGDYEKTAIIGALLVGHRGLFRSADPVKPFLKLSILEDPDEMRMKGYLLDNISRSSRILTDEKKLYMLNWLGLNHFRVTERGDDSPPERIKLILEQVVQAFRKNFTGLPDTYLPLYLNEFVFRYNHKEEEDRGFLKLLSLLLESQEYPLSFFRRTQVRGNFIIQLIESVLRRDEKKAAGTNPAARKKAMKSSESGD